MARLRTLLRAVAGGFGLAAAWPGPPASACGSEGADMAASGFVRLTGQGDIVLSDQSLARLAGIRLIQPAPGQPDPLADTLLALVRPWQGGARVLFRPGAQPDRWGRRPASLMRDAGPRDADLGLNLVRNGLAITWSTELPPNCRILYLQAEDAARRENLGRWAAMQHRALDAADGAGVAARAGQVAVMSGRINHVGQTRRASWLNFGARGSGASAELSLSVWRALEREGWTRDGLKGKIVRVRGVVMDGRPPRLLLGDASAIEFLN